MTHFTTMPITFARVAIFAASAMVALSSTSVGHASCGEYVYSRFRTPSHHASMPIRPVDVDKLAIANSQIMRAATQGLPVDVNESASQPAAPAPCHGPNCSQNPTPLVPVPPSSNVGRSNPDRLVCGYLSAEFPSEVCLRRDLETNARKRRGYPLLIEMPPETVG